MMSTFNAMDLQYEMVEHIVKRFPFLRVHIIEDNTGYPPATLAVAAEVPCFTLVQLFNSMLRFGEVSNELMAIANSHPNAGGDGVEFRKMTAHYKAEAKKHKSARKTAKKKKK